MEMGMRGRGYASLSHLPITAHIDKGLALGTKLRTDFFFFLEVLSSQSSHCRQSSKNASA